MISGAVGAVTGEVLAEAFNPIADLRAEIYAEHPNFDALSKADQWSILQSKTDTHRKAWKLVSAITGGVFGGNANVAYQAADTAIENNYVHVVLAAMTIGYIGYVGYQVGSAIYDGDYEEALKTLGIEVVTFAVGGVVAKGAVAGGKIAFRFVGSTKTYATVAEALSAAYEKTPGLKLCMHLQHFLRFLLAQMFVQPVPQTISQRKIGMRFYPSPLSFLKGRTRVCWHRL
ncbi:MAG: hypothetical protein NEHIOOID_01389 [Holosporales bacterium]